MFYQRRNRRGLVAVVLLLLVSVSPAMAQEVIDEEANAAIRKQGLEQSQVMETLSWMTDVYGPRLTGSPGLDKASDWTLTKFEEWGLAILTMKNGDLLETDGPCSISRYTLREIPRSRSTPIPRPGLLGRMAPSKQKWSCSTPRRRKTLPGMRGS